MADRDLQTINSSGDITGLNFNGTDSGDAVLTDDEIDALVAATYGTSAFCNAVGASTNITGVISLDDLVSLNADISKLDIVAFDYYIQGIKYSYAGGTAISPTIGAGDSSTFIGVDASGLVYSEDKFTETQTLTIIPIARMQAVQGDSGPGSDLQTPIHLMYTIGQEGHEGRAWLEGVIGALYESGGLYAENAGTPLQVDQTAGSFHNAQRKHIAIAADTNIEASALYNVSGTPTLQARATLVIPKFYDNGTDIAALSNNKYASHTLLRSPKAEDVFIFVYGDTEFNSQAEAEQAPVDFNIFQSQSVSGLLPVARFVLKGDSSNIISIVDERPIFGGSTSSITGTASLQQIYENSSTPEILTDTTRGALSIKRGTALDTDNVIEGLNGAGATTYSVDGNGDVTAVSFTGDGSALTGLPGGGDLLSTNNLSDVTNASTSRDNLGLTIGTNVQAYDAGLLSIAGLTTLADRMIYTTASDTYAVATLTAAGRALIDDADISAQRTTLGLVIGTDVQAYDAGLLSIAGLTTLADRMIYTTASDTYAVATLTTAGRAILDDADASAQRTTLGVAIGSDVQAYDADTAKTDVAQTFSAAQRTSTTAEDNAISFNGNNNFTLTATAANITVTNQTIGQGGTIVITTASNITGWGTEFDWGNAGEPTGLGALETFAYYISGASGADSIKIGRL